MINNKRQSKFYFQELLPILVLIIPVLVLSGLIGGFTVVQAKSPTAIEGPVSPNAGIFECLASDYNCVAQDVKIKELKVVEIVSGCSASSENTATVRIQSMVEAAKDTRYDIGVYIALDGGNIIGGSSCYHDYYESPVTATPVYGDFNGDTIPDIFKNFPPQIGFSGFWDGDQDTCGDMEPSTQIIKVMDTLVTIACVDTDADGFVDINACASWWNNGKTNACGSASQAYPETKSKCGCTRVNTNIPTTPTAVVMLNFTARPNPWNVELNWESVMESNALGFNLYRSESLDGERLLVNPELIPSKSLGGTGAIYEYADQGALSGATYYYWLEFIDISTKEEFGPVSATLLGNKVFLPVMQRF